MNAIERLAACDRLLEHCGGLLGGSLREGNQQDEPPALILQRAFAYGRQDLAALIQMIQKGEGYALFLAPIARPFYELAARVLWATREPSGWQRLQAHWAEADKKWATEMKDDSELGDHAKLVLARADEVLKRTDATGQPFRPAPNLQQTLTDIERHNTGGGAKTPVGFAAYEYANVYRLLCRPAHAHITTIGQVKPDRLLHQAVVVAVLAVRSLLHACCHVASSTKEDDIEDCDVQIVPLIKGTRDTTFDELRKNGDAGDAKRT